MDISNASKRIGKALNQLEQTLGESVFDEWVLVKRGANGWRMLQYNGPREEALQAEFAEDMESLRQVLDLSKVHAGDFAFVHDGYGSAFDAYMGAGDGVLALFNHTVKSTSEITSHPRWKTAQVHFNDLLEAFIADPVA